MTAHEPERGLDLDWLGDLYLWSFVIGLITVFAWIVVTFSG
jgi:hypothetical protein